MATLKVNNMPLAGLLIVIPVLLIFFFLGVLMIFGSASNIYEYYHFKKTAVKTEGTITKISRHTSRGKHGRVSFHYYPTITFSDEANIEHTFASKVEIKGKDYDFGKCFAADPSGCAIFTPSGDEKIGVYYDKNDPHKAVAERSLGSFFGEIFVFCFGLPFMILPAFIGGMLLIAKVKFNLEV